MNPQGQQNSTDHTANFFWLLVLLCLAFLGVWFFRPQWVINPIYWMRLHEINGMIYLSGVWAKVAHFFHFTPPNTHELFQLKRLVVGSTPSKVPFAQFAGVNSLIGSWVRWPTAAILLILAIVAFFRHAAVRFRQTYNIKTLKLLENENWPQITPVVSLNLVDEDLEKGPWAMARSPLDYCKEHKIASLKHKDGKKIWEADKGPAARLFTLQLGPLWKDLLAGEVILELESLALTVMLPEAVLVPKGSVPVKVMVSVPAFESMIKAVAVPAAKL